MTANGPEDDRFSQTEEYTSEFVPTSNETPEPSRPKFSWEEESPRSIVTTTSTLPGAAKKADEPYAHPSAPIPAEPMSETAKKVEDSGKVDDMALRKALLDHEEQKTSYQKSIDGWLGKTGLLNPEEAAKAAQAERETAIASQARWTEAKKWYDEKRGPNADADLAAANAALGNAVDDYGIPLAGDSFGSMVAKKLGRNIDDAKKRQEEADAIIAGKKDPFVQEIWRNTLENSAKGVVNSLASSTIKSVGYGYGFAKQAIGLTSDATDNSVYATGAAIEKWAEKTFPTDPARKEEWSSVVGQGAGSMLGLLTPAIGAKVVAQFGPRILYSATKGSMGLPALAEGATMAERTIEASRLAASGNMWAGRTVGITGSLTTSAEMSDEYVKHQKAKGEPVDPRKLVGLYAMGLGIGYTERLSIDAVLNRHGGSILAAGLVQMIEEGGQEFASQVMQNVAAIGMYDDKRHWDDNAWTGAAVGAILGGAMGGSSALMGKMGNKWDGDPDAPEVTTGDVNAKMKTVAPTAAMPAAPMASAPAKPDPLQPVAPGASPAPAVAAPVTTGMDQSILDELRAIDPEMAAEAERFAKVSTGTKTDASPAATSEVPPAQAEPAIQPMLDGPSQPGEAGRPTVTTRTTGAPSIPDEIMAILRQTNPEMARKYETTPEQPNVNISTSELMFGRQPGNEGSPEKLVQALSKFSALDLFRVAEANGLQVTEDGRPLAQLPANELVDGIVSATAAKMRSRSAVVSRGGLVQEGIPAAVQVDEPQEEAIARLEEELPAIAADIEQFMVDSGINDVLSDPEFRAAAQQVLDGIDLAAAVAGTIAARSATPSQAAPELSANIPAQNAENADAAQKPAVRGYPQFVEMLAGKTPASKWASEMGVDQASLDGLIQQALLDGRLAMVGGKPRRTPKAKVLPNVELQDAPQPIVKESLTIAAPAPAQAAPQPTLTRAEEKRLEAVKDELAYTHAKRLLDTQSDAVQFADALKALRSDKKLTKAKMAEVFKAYTGSRKAPPKTKPKAIEALKTVRDQRAEKMATAPVAQPAIPVAQPVETISITTPYGDMEIVGQVEIVDISTLKKATGSLQPRDRSRAESQETIRAIASKLDPAQLMPSRVSDSGAPIVAADGTVISGNGRVEAIRQVYANADLAARAQAYRDAIGDAGGIAQPVKIVRLPAMSRAELERFADLSNRSRISSMSATERAQRDAKAVGSDILGLYVGGPFTTVQNQDFYRAFVAKIPANERGAFSRDGVLSKEGEDRMSAAILAAAYGDPQMLSRMLEDTDDNIKSITGAMRDAAGAFIRQKAAIASGQASPKFDITPQVSEVAKRIADLRDRGITPREFLAQMDAFTTVDPIVESLLVAFYNEKMSRQLSREKLTEILTRYANEATKHADGGLFEDTTKPKDIIAIARSRALEGERLALEQTDIFSASQGATLRDNAGDRGAGSGPGVDGRGQGTDQAQGSQTLKPLMAVQSAQRPKIHVVKPISGQFSHDIETDAIESAYRAIGAGNSVVVTPSVVNRTLDVLRDMSASAPAGVGVGTIAKIRPMGGDKVEAVIRLTDGSLVSLNLSGRALLGNQSARAFHIGLADSVAVERGIQSIVVAINYTDNLVVGSQLARIAGTYVHETVHALRSGGYIPQIVWQRFVDHAYASGALEISFERLQEANGGLPTNDKQAIGPFYADFYERQGYDDAGTQERLDQEAAAHFAELASHGFWDADTLAPVQDILDGIESGAFSQVAQERELEDAAFAMGGRANVTDPLGYYSKAIEAARGLKQAKGTPEQMLAQLKAAGVKQAELDATGLSDAFDGQKTITRDAIVQHLEENRVEIKEVRYGVDTQAQRDEFIEAAGDLGIHLESLGNSDDAVGAFMEHVGDRSQGGTSRPPKVVIDEKGLQLYERALKVTAALPQAKWAEHSLDKDNPTYRETVLHLPDRADGLMKKANALDAEVDAAWARGDDETARRLEMERDQFAMADGRRDPTFRSGHFSEPNIVGHLMTSTVKDADGRPVYLIDQIQSDWGQKLRDGGVRDEAKIAELKKRNAAAVDVIKSEQASVDQFLRSAQYNTSVMADDAKRVAIGKIARDDFSKAERGNRIVSDAMKVEADRLLSTWDKAVIERNLTSAELATATASAPGHPLVNTTDQWTNTTLRRAIRQAAEQNAHAIAIPSGDTVLSYNPEGSSGPGGMRGFYGTSSKEGIVPKNLRNLLTKIDKNSPKPTRVEKLDAPSKGMTNKGDLKISDGGTDFGFTVFELTDAVKRSVLDEGQPMFAFGGVNARTADKEKLVKAKAMDADGTPREKIWIETGWFKGVDGKWRFEIDDSGAFLTGDPSRSVRDLFGSKPRALGKVFEHDLAYEAYPGLASQRIGQADLAANSYGQVDPINGIRLNANKDMVTLDSVVLHELQHVIQEMEGLATGGNPDDAARLAVRRGLTAEQKKSAEVRQLLDRIGNLRVEILKLGVSKSMLPSLGNMRIRRRIRELTEQMELLSDQLGLQIERMPRRAKTDLEIQWGLSSKEKFDFYQRLAGEVEARAVQTRMNLSPEQRAARPPWLDYDVPESEQIISTNSGMSGAIAFNELSIQDKIANMDAVSRLIDSLPTVDKPLVRSLTDDFDLSVSKSGNYATYYLVKKGQPLADRKGNIRSIGAFLVKPSQRMDSLGVEVTNARLDETYQRQGLGTLVYDTIAQDMESVGGVVPSPDDQLSDAAKAFWAQRRDATILKRRITNELGENEDGIPVRTERRLAGLDDQGSLTDSTSEGAAEGRSEATDVPGSGETSLEDGSEGRDGVRALDWDWKDQVEAVKGRGWMEPEAKAERQKMQGWNVKGWHGTTRDFEIPDPNRGIFGYHVSIGTPRASNLRLGFGDNALERAILKSAPKAADAQIQPVMVRAESQLRLPHFDWDDPKSWLKAVKAKRYAGSNEFRDYILANQETMPMERGADFRKWIINALEVSGHDSIIYKSRYEDAGRDSLFVWDARNVRSQLDLFDERAENDAGLTASRTYLRQDLEDLVNGLIEETVSTLPRNRSNGSMSTEQMFNAMLEPMYAVRSDGTPRVASQPSRDAQPAGKEPWSLDQSTGKFVRTSSTQDRPKVQLSSVDDILSDAGITFRKETSRSNTERFGPSLSTYYHIETANGSRKIRVSDHSYLTPENGVDILLGSDLNRATASVLNLVGKPLPSNLVSLLAGDARDSGVQKWNAIPRQNRSEIVRALENRGAGHLVNDLNVIAELGKRFNHNTMFRKENRERIVSEVVAQHSSPNIMYAFNGRSTANLAAERAYRDALAELDAARKNLSEAVASNSESAIEEAQARMVRAVHDKDAANAKRETSGSAFGDMTSANDGQPMFALNGKRSLDSSPEARKARAEEMGFDTSKVWYHGSNAEFDAFDLNARKPGLLTEFLPKQRDTDLGIHLTMDRDVAATYGKAGEYYVRGEVLSVASKWDAYRDGLTPRDVAKLKADGYSAILGREEGELVVFDPSNIRSVNAMFDPDKSDSPNIMYAFNGRRTSTEAERAALADKFDTKFAGQSAPALNKIITDLKQSLGIVTTQGLWGMTVKQSTTNDDGSTTVREKRLRPSSRMRGMFRPRTGAISLRLSRDISVIAHEGGHALEQKLGYELSALKEAHRSTLEAQAYAGATDNLSEGFAEWFKGYIVDAENAKAKAPEFAAALEDLIDSEMPGALAQLIEVQSAYAAHIKQSPLQSLSNDLVSTYENNTWAELNEPGFIDSVPGRLSTAYTATIDALHPLNLMVRRLLEVADKNGVRDHENKPISVATHENPYKLSRLFADAYSRGRMWLENGIADYGSDVIASRSLHDAMTTLFKGEKWNKQTYKDFGAYLVSRRAVAEYDLLAQKQSALQQIDTTLDAVDKARPMVADRAAKDAAIAERRQNAVIREQTLLSDRRRQLSSARTQMQNLQVRLSDLMDDRQLGQTLANQTETASQMAARRQRSIGIASRDASRLSREIEALELEVDEREVGLSMISNEAEQAQDAATASRQRVEQLDALTARLRKERAQRADLGASRPPTLQPREFHAEVIARVEADTPQFVEASKIVYEWTHQLLKVRRQAGFLTQEQFEVLAQRKDWYVPFQRDMSDVAPEAVFTGETGPKKWSPFKKFDGSDRAIVNPLEVLSQQAYTTAQQIAFNDIIVSMSKLADRVGPGSGQILETLTQATSAEANSATFDKIKNTAIALGIDPIDAHLIVQSMEQNFSDADVQLIWSPENKGPMALPTLPMWRNGERILVRMPDPEFGKMVFEAVNGMGKEARNMLDRIGGGFSTALRVGVTTHPDFILGNLLRDIPAMYIIAGAIPGVAHVKGLYHYLMNTDTARLYNEAGGIMGGANVAASRKSDRRVDILSLKNKGYKFEPRTFWHVIEAVETAGRMGVFAHSLKQAMLHDPSLTPYQAAQDAAYVTRDVIDFGRRGSKSAAMMRVVTFMNAHVQGMDKAQRLFKADSDRGSVMAKQIGLVLKRESGAPLSRNEERALADAYKGLIRLTLFTAFALALVGMMWDDPEYKDIKDQTKNKHNWFKMWGQWFRMPAPFELALPTRYVEIIADKIAGRNEEMAKRLAASAWDALAPPILPQIANLGVGLGANYDNFRGRPIVGDHLQGLDPALRFDAYTSQLSIDMAKAVQATGVPRNWVPSPKMLDFLITSGGAYWGKEAQNIYSGGKKALGLSNREAWQWTDLPVVRRVTGVPAQQSRSIEGFYKMVGSSGGELTSAANSYKNYIDKQGQPEAAAVYLSSLKPEERAYAFLMQHRSADEKRSHPLERMKIADATLRDMRKEMILDTLTDKNRKGKREWDTKVVLSPTKQTEVHEILQKLGALEGWNAMVLMKRPGWEDGKMYDPKPLEAVLKAASPDVYRILEARRAKAKMPDWDQVRRDWPKMREDLLKEAAKPL